MALSGAERWGWLTGRYRWGAILATTALTCGLALGSLGMGCQELACRNDYNCGGYQCDPTSVTCKTSCESDADCAQGLGFQCQDGKCVCDKSKEGAYCRKSCRSDDDCAALPECQQGADTLSGAGTTNLCNCKDPCFEGLASCLTPDAGQTPLSAPKQCVVITSDTTDPFGTDTSGDDAGDSWDWGTSDLDGGTGETPDEDFSWGVDDDVTTDAGEQGLSDDLSVTDGDSN